MVETMGDHNAVLLRAHGAVIGAESIPALMVDAVHFDENARALYDASRLGTPTPLTKEESDQFAANFIDTPQEGQTSILDGLVDAERGRDSNNYRCYRHKSKYNHYFFGQCSQLCVGICICQMKTECV